MREYATGEVFTARRAQELGLVDELGDAEAPKELAAQMAGFRSRMIHTRPPRPFIRRIFGGMATELAEQVEARLATRLLYH